ncbi:MAG: Protein of unknown function DUF1553/DUF1549/Planctomycete cytochrome C [Verrucomicrobia bacterium]|nr:MAG: Protein of unknown function DUF1553/DUF1549/Planctomycete cytochrome C [Verrucomicrobiota bacterium]
MRLFPAACLFFCSLSVAFGGSAVGFNRDVRPILAENCFACHGFDKKGRKADLRLDTREGALAVLSPHNLEESALLDHIFAEDEEELMPPRKSGKQLSAAQKETIRRWIAEGAVYEKHWAFEPPTAASREGRGDASAIDDFIRSKLKAEGIEPSPEADPETLIRRVSLDLTGLPPAPQEIDAFLVARKEDPEKAYGDLVDRLLRSPHYGERWARWWLDQARYADSNGYSIDAPRQIWKFRDWVIGAFNAGMPFDRFTVEQLAGDLLPGATESQRIATGFHRNTQINQEGGIDKEQFRMDSVFDRVATTGTVWLGLSIGCAQCHDHKFDPIEQREYYRMFAFLNSQEEPVLKVSSAGVDFSGLTVEFKGVERQIAAFMAEHAAELASWEAGLTPSVGKQLSSAVTAILKVPKERRSFDQSRALFAAGIGIVGPFRVLNDRYTELDAILNGGVTTLVLAESSVPRKTHVLIKGDFTRPAEEVNPGTPAVLHPMMKVEGRRPNRLDLANWIMSPENPLTARVIVNRVWQQYFGRGLVETENDFGMQGTAPSHPELLDWLAVRFREGGWDLKELHRRIVTSKTYRQSSVQRPELRERDPGNYLLARQQRLRLDAEIVRDVALVASGLFSPKLGGPPVYPPIPDGVMGQGQVKRTWPVSKGEDRYRRGLYTFVYRASPPPSLTVFDAPEGYSTCTRRIRSNTPLQALTLLNDAAFFECATALGGLIQREGLEEAFHRCTSRKPGGPELAVLAGLALEDAARVLLNLDETVTRE